MKTNETRKCHVPQYVSPTVDDIDFVKEAPILCASANVEEFGNVTSLSPDSWLENF